MNNSLQLVQKLFLVALGTAALSALFAFGFAQAAVEPNVPYTSHDSVHTKSHAYVPPRPRPHNAHYHYNAARHSWYYLRYNPHTHNYYRYYVR